MQIYTVLYIFSYSRLTRHWLSETVHERESGAINISVLKFQIKAYQDFGIVSDWLIEKIQYKIGRKEVQSSYRILCGNEKINFQTENPSVMHTKYECTKSQWRESREKKTTWESPYLLAPSSGYKIKIHVTIFLFCASKVLTERVRGNETTFK